MADTRINALSTATVSLSDDYLPIDGTTAGTKKLSAYSPSFGGNATVGGTLTVSGTGTSTFAGGVTIRRDQAALTGLIVDNRNGGGTSDLILSEDGGSSNYFRIYRSGSTTGTPNVVNISNIVGGSATTTAIEFGSPVKALSTTASTSTSSGALVVSGGVGVAGAIYAGGALTAAGYSRFTGDTTGGGSDVWVGAAGDGGIFVNTPAGESIYFGINNTPTVTIAAGTFTVGGTVIANAASNALRITNSQTPASAAATGTAGTIAWDTSYIYVCTATNTWKRVAISTW